MTRIGIRTALVLFAWLALEGTLTLAATAKGVVEEELNFSEPVSKLPLSGTLTLPEGNPRALVLLISGSGAQDRDYQLFGHALYRDLAHRLARDGIASVRLDDRGTGQSAPPLTEGPMTNDIADLRAALKHARRGKTLHSVPAGAIGHSEGALLAAKLARSSTDLKFIVLLAPTGQSGREVLIAQNDRLSRRVQMEPADRAGFLADIGSLLDAVYRGDPVDSVKSQLEAIWNRIPPETRTALGYNASMVDGTVALFASQRFKDFLHANPAEEIQSLNIPVLAIAGGKDTQAPPAANAPPLRDALAQGHPANKLIVYPELNHLLQKAQSGEIEEYSKLADGFSPEPVDALCEWVLALVGEGSR